MLLVGNISSFTLMSGFWRSNSAIICGIAVSYGFTELLRNVISVTPFVADIGLDADDSEVPVANSMEETMQIQQISKKVFFIFLLSFVFIIFLNYSICQIEIYNIFFQYNEK
jgi:hypothetical protein